MTALVKEATDGEDVFCNSPSRAVLTKTGGIGADPITPYIHQPSETWIGIRPFMPGTQALWRHLRPVFILEDLLARIRAKGVEIVELTLHVGLGTFRPVQVQEIEKHTMHSEYYRIGRKRHK